MAQKIDIFHPLAYLDWKEYSISSSHHRSSTDFQFDQCVVFEDKVYIALHKSGSKLGVFSIDFDSSSWHTVDVPSIFFSLAIYNSQLVLVGGKEESMMQRRRSLLQYEITNKLWASGDWGNSWESSLPPMPTKRYLTSAVSYGGSPECLIVAGGRTSDGNTSYLVEVLKEGQWFTAQSLPRSYTSTKSATLHKGYWYLTGRRSSGTLRGNLNAIVTSVSSTGGEEIVPKISLKPTEEAWKRCEIHSCLVSCGEHLLALRYSNEEKKLIVHAYHPLTQSWVIVQYLRSSMIPRGCNTLPTGELLVMGIKKVKRSCFVSMDPAVIIKASFKGICNLNASAS